MYGLFKGLTDRVSSRLGGLAVLWRPRPSGPRQYIMVYVIMVYELGEDEPHRSPVVALIYGKKAVDSSIGMCFIA